MKAKSNVIVLFLGVLFLSQLVLLNPVMTGGYEGLCSRRSYSRFEVEWHPLGLGSKQLWSIGGWYDCK
jgi:hypothetical protein